MQVYEIEEEDETYQETEEKPRKQVRRQIIAPINVAKPISKQIAS